MARADLLVFLVESIAKGDKLTYRKTVEAIIAEERQKQHNVLANKLERIIHSTPPERSAINGAHVEQKSNNLVQEILPKKKFADLILNDKILEICEAFVNEHHRAALLRTYNLEPRNRILLVGPPGNGKTSLAEAIAEALAIPLFVVRYESLIGSYLGETAGRLSKLFDFASTNRCVLFFDEFETLAKERGDTHETGEIKRVVSSLLLQIDRLPSHVVVIGATNHPELLDRAVWRRFQVRLNLGMPTRDNITQWFIRFQARVGVELGYAPETLAKSLFGKNFAEIEEFGQSVYRQYVLNMPNTKMKDIISKTLKTWREITTEVKQENMGG
ncbi:MAG: ATP-binding protein [Geovibrio sp.]|uniref:AAA family ATPase n=1 Tax=Geovibrio ferrireducens TaxID=46201 RepID=UPI0022454836|nr:ATP-binding protein [Geovibrio ferrireducens]MCD8568328.1 ATP-binding protein [Geovibrio sp.]